MDNILNLKVCLIFFYEIQKKLNPSWISYHLARTVSLCKSNKKLGVEIRAKRLSA